MTTAVTGTLSPALRFVLFTSGLAITVAALRLSATLLVPLALALFITVVSLPLLLRLVARRVPVGLAALIVLVVDVTVLLGFVWLLVRSLAQITAAVPGYLEQLRAAEASLVRWLADRGIQMEAMPSLDAIRAEDLIGLVGTFLRGATDVVTTVFLVALITVFVLLESAIFPQKLRRALGKRGQSLDWLATVMTDVQQYLALKTLVSAATGLLIGLGAWLLGVDFALLWGLLAFLLNFIPNVGSILAAIPAVLVALLQLGIGPGLALAALFLAVNLAIGNLIEPALMGRRLGLSPLIVVLSLIFWGWVWGPIGMFLAVPLTMAGKIVLEHTSGYRWLAVLMGGPGSLTRPADDVAVDSLRREPPSEAGERPRRTG